MDHLSYSTIFANSRTANKKWVVVDAENQPLGRLASRVAMVLRGKHKASYTPHSDSGDNVIVINADKVRLSGNKMETKTYRVHSGYPGGQKELKVKQMLHKKPYYLVEEAVRGMLPKNRLGRHVFGNLKVYSGNEHPHTAQNPTVLNLNDIK
ncbi:MAG: 50S ribosomal protein L13 [Candidatus Competibacteraceae bacterium]|nr:50S ribosomal protein L13 [Candidatus Competibacteraceae bacterium]